MKRKRNIWPFGKGQPLGAKSTHHRRASKPVSDKALAKQAKEREAERLERKMSDAQFETKLRKHYARGGNLREFLQANPALYGIGDERGVPIGRAYGTQAGAFSEARSLAAAGQRVEVVWKGRDGKFQSKWFGKVGRANPLDETRVFIGPKRKDGKYSARFVYEGTGRKIDKLLDDEKLAQLRSDPRYAVYASGRSNPADAAADVYEEFHGRPSEEVVTVTEKIHYHEHLAALGELRTLVVQARDGGKVTLSRFKKAILCCNEAKTQMFIRGGDQAVDLEAFGIRTVHEVETLGRVVELAYFTTKDHLGDEGGTAVYFHVSGRDE